MQQRDGVNPQCDSWLFDLLYRYNYIYQCLGLVLWSTEVLTEGLPASSIRYSI